jgi:hypothetical protein
MQAPVPWRAGVARFDGISVVESAAWIPEWATSSLPSLRVTDVAEPGTIVASEAVVEAATGAYAWTALRDRSLKGVEEKVRLLPPCSI